MKYNIKYTSEYIPKLQIHQHSLLTRKVFSWHNSSSLDRHQSWIIIIIVDAISSKWCYLSNLLVIGSSIYPTLFHAICRPSLHVGLHRQSHPFFMLYVGLHLQSQLFSMLDVGLHLQSQPFFMLDVGLIIFNTCIWTWEDQPATC